MNLININNDLKDIDSNKCIINITLNDQFKIDMLEKIINKIETISDIKDITYGINIDNNIKNICKINLLFSHN